MSSEFYPVDIVLVYCLIQGVTSLNWHSHTKQLILKRLNTIENYVSSTKVLSNFLELEVPVIVLIM